jgi:iron complex transport system ATP-binding protein
LNNLLISDLTVVVNNKTIIESFNMTAQPGDSVFITGDNGSGKSTILKAVARYQSIASGTISLGAKDAFAFSLSDWHQHVHYLPQHNPLAFPVKVKDLLLMAFYREKKWFDSYSNQHLQQVQQLAGIFNISHLLDRNAKELSGGELQLCWLVQSLLAKPEVLLLDEPTQYLDAKNRTAFFSILHTVQLATPFICLCVTHDLPFKKEDYGTVISL